MTKEQRERVAFLKREANEPKSRLIDILNKVDQISPRQADGISRAIAMLERWQNKR